MNLRLQDPKAWITSENPFELVCVVRKTRIPLAAAISSRIEQVAVASQNFGNKMKLQFVPALAGQFKEIQIILRLFLVIAMYYQASSSQFNESQDLPRC